MPKRPHIVRVTCDGCGAIAGESYGAKGFMRHADNCPDIVPQGEEPAQFRRARYFGELNPDFGKPPIFQRELV